MLQYRSPVAKGATGGTEEATMRFKKISRNELQIGQRVRIVQRRYFPAHGDQTIISAEGEVESVEWARRPKSSILADAAAAMEEVVTGIQLLGWNVPLNIGPGWEVVSIEAVAPPLPTTAGSVILIGDRAAVYRNISYSDVEPAIYRWIWADDPDSDRGPSDQQLNEADIIHTARRA